MPFVLDQVDGGTASCELRAESSELRAANCELPSRDEDQMRSVTRGVHTADEWAHSL